jgi:hypothetical protein
MGFPSDSGTRVSRTWGFAGGSLVRRGSAADPAGWRPASHARPADFVRAGDYRASRQMALRTRRKSTCRRTTSNGSVTLITPGSHVTDGNVQAASGMWTVRWVTSGGIRVATCHDRPAIPGRAFSALAEPGEGWLGLVGGGRPRRPGRRKVLAVAPGATRALLMVPLPARDADHVSIVRRHLCIASPYRGKPRTCTGTST